MPRFTRRRFSATPRRRWFGARRSSSQGTLTPRLQVAQFNISQDFVVTSSSNESLPDFFVQAMAPWSNLSESGYDRSLFIHGIVWNLNCLLLGHELDSGGGFVDGPTLTERYMMPLASWWFVDATDSNDAPVSFNTVPFGPFISTPPIGAPGSLPPDSNLFPTRVLKRTHKQLLAGMISNSPSRGERDFDVSALSQFNWSGVLRKRFAVDDRQGLYWGIFGFTPAQAAGASYTYRLVLNGSYYYKLRR